MPKTKTHSGAKKRFSLTATKKIKRACAFKSHNLANRKKSHKQKKRLTKSRLVHVADARAIYKLLHV